MVPGVENITSVEVRNAAAALRGQTVVENGETVNPHVNVISALEYIANQIAAIEAMQENEETIT